MNKNLGKVCRFLVENKIADKDLTLDFDERILMYKDFEWDLNSEYIEVEVKDYDGEYEELLIEDCDQYKLTIDCYGHIEVETPEDEAEEEFNKDEYIKELEQLVAKQSALIKLLKNGSPFNF